MSTPSAGSPEATIAAGENDLQPLEVSDSYAYDAPTDALPIARGGDTLLIRCEYDNSLDNPALAEVLAERGLDAPVDVELGDGTLDEMCLGVFGVIYPRALADEGWRP